MGQEWVVVLGEVLNLNRIHNSIEWSANQQSTRLRYCRALLNSSHSLQCRQTVSVEVNLMAFNGFVHLPVNWCQIQRMNPPSMQIGRFVDSRLLARKWTSLVAALSSISSGWTFLAYRDWDDRWRTCATVARPRNSPSNMRLSVDATLPSFGCRCHRPA